MVLQLFFKMQGLRRRG